MRRSAGRARASAKADPGEGSIGGAGHEMNLEPQLLRNIDAFNTERVNWPDKSRVSWLMDIYSLADMAGVRVVVDLAGFLHSDNSRQSVTKIATDKSRENDQVTICAEAGDENCHLGFGHDGESRT